jgi:nicotinate-nucleotide adenylyltransferase
MFTDRPAGPVTPGPQPRRTAIFGGTFDPVHLGHVGMAQAAVQRCAIDQVVFVPCRQSPHKDNPADATGGQRCAMLQLALGSYPWASVDRFELDKGSPSYSWETARHFRDATPAGVSLYWILGADQWEALGSWKHPERLAATVTFLVFSRGDSPLSTRPGVRARFVTYDHPASATALRRALAQGAPVPEGWLDPSVAGYIRRNGLYGGGAGPKAHG